MFTEPRADRLCFARTISLRPTTDKRITNNQNRRSAFQSGNAGREFRKIDIGGGERNKCRRLAFNYTSILSSTKPLVYRPFIRRSVGVHVRVRLVFGRAAERRFRRRRRRHRVLLDIYGGQSQISGVRRAPFD